MLEKNGGSFRLFHDPFFFGWHQELVPFLDLCSALAGSVGVSLRFVKAISGMHVGRCRNET